MNRVDDPRLPGMALDALALTLTDLRLNPDWDVLRENERFRALMAE
jgi:hypothetical protein